MKKYNRKRAKLHFFKIFIFEKISVLIERLFLKIKSYIRFVKNDKQILYITIKEIISVSLLIFICNSLFNYLNGISEVRNLCLVSYFLDNTTFLTDNFIQFLLACLGVGVFLVALFLSNLSNLITAKYMNIVSKVSVSILTEFTNKKYLQSMINYLTLTIILLFCYIFKISVNPMVAILLIFMTVRIIIIYFNLAQRVFLFSDINMLTQAVYQEINYRFSYLKKAIKKNKSDSVFNSYGTQLISLLNTMKELQIKSISDDARDDVASFTNYIIAIAVKYSEFKNTIPRDSKWFRIKYEPSNWFEADFYEVNLRTTTGTSINSKSIVDLYFLENIIKEMFMYSIIKLIEKKDDENLFKIINNYYLSLDSILVNGGDFSYWNEFTEELDKLIIKSDLDETDYFKSIVDIISLNKVTFVLKAQKYTESTFEELINNYKNNNKEFIVNGSNNNYLYVTPDISDFIEKLNSEKNIEGSLITGFDYIYEFLFNSFKNEISKHLEIIKNIYSKASIQAKELINQNRSVSSCLMYSRLEELNNKICNYLYCVKNIEAEIDLYQYNFKFKNIDFKVVEKELDDSKINNLIEYAKSYLSDDSCEFIKCNVDFCGEIFYYFSKAIADSILENDFEKFKKIYTYYPSICLSSENFLQTTLNKDFNPNYLISKYKIPFIHYMNLSGCAILHSHVVNDNRWEELVKNTYNSLVEKLPKEYYISKKLALYASIDVNSFDMNDMSINLRQGYSGFLQSSEYIKVKICNNSFIRRKVIDTDDELIKAFVNIHFDEYFDFYYKFYEIFLFYYVNPFLEEPDKYECRMKVKKRGVKNGK